jgi:hypothetical protein
MGWWNYQWGDLEPETAASIRSAPVQPKKWGNIWACGCEESHQTEPLSLHLCHYHEGFDEGVAAVRAD